MATIAGAARVERITIDLERPKQPFTLQLTSSTDTEVQATLFASGSEFNPEGWQGILWYGDVSGGIAITNSTSMWGVMSWDVTANLLPTNGRYSAQILGARGGRLEEWCTGVLQVRGGLGSTMPPDWTTAGPAAYDMATNALAKAELVEGWGDWGPRVGALESYSNIWTTAHTWGNHALAGYLLPSALINYATTNYVSNYVAAHSTPSDKIITQDNTQWIDATGVVWRVGPTPLPWDGKRYRVVFSDDFVLKNLDGGTDVYPPAYEVIGNFGDQILPNGWDIRLGFYSSDPWLVHPTNLDAGDSIRWYGPPFEYPIPHPDMPYTPTVFENLSVYELQGTVLFDRAYDYIVTTNTVGTIATHHDLTSATTSATNHLVHNQNGTATNLTIRGYVDLPQTAATNLVLRLTVSNEYIFAQEVWK